MILFFTPPPRPLPRFSSCRLNLVILFFNYFFSHWVLIFFCLLLLTCFSHSPIFLLTFTLTPTSLTYSEYITDQIFKEMQYLLFQKKSSSFEWIIKHGALRIICFTCEEDKICKRLKSSCKVRSDTL